MERVGLKFPYRLSDSGALLESFEEEKEKETKKKEEGGRISFY